MIVKDYNYKDITSTNNEMMARARQGNKIACRIKELTEQNFTIIGDGDLNTGRRDNRNAYWRKDIFENKLPNELCVIMPDGVSHKPKGYAGCPDLLFYTKNLNVNCEPYNWNFVNACKDIYVHGKFTEEIPAPYPDHAQIIADFNF